MTGVDKGQFFCQLLGVMSIFALTGCQQNYDELKKVKVDYNDSREYTVTFDKNDMLDITDNGDVQDENKDMPIEFKDITKDDIIIGYDYVSPEKVESTDEITAESKLAEVTDFKNDGKEITLTFKDDPNALNNTEGPYCIVIAKAKKAVLVETVVPDNTLSADKEEVMSDSTENTITLTSKEGKFSPTITKENITLDYSFKDMNIESLEVNGRKLTIKLSGSPVLLPDISPTYTAGEIEIAPEGFEKALTPEEITFDIALPAISIDTKGIEGGDGNYTVPINVDGIDTSNIKASDVSLGDNVKVKDIKKKNGKIIAEVEADDIDQLSGYLRIGDNEVLSNFGHASFYPLPIDYIKDGDNFIIALSLVPVTGRFDNSIDEEDINLLDGFENAEIRYMELDNGNVYLELQVPSNGVSLEDMNILGTIEVKDGGMIEAWGEDAPEYYTTAAYNKDFFAIVNATNPDMVSDNVIENPVGALFGGGVVYAAENNNDAKSALSEQTKTNNKRKAIRGAVDYTLDKLGHVDSTSAEVSKYGKVAFSFGMGIATGNPADIVAGVTGLLDSIGVFNGETDPNNPKNKTLDDKIDDINVLLNAMDEKLDTIIKNQYKEMTQGYDDALDALGSDCSRAENMYKKAADMYKETGGVVPGKNASIEEVKAYNEKLMKIVLEGEKNGNSSFRGYTNLINRIEKNYLLVTTETSKNWEKNPIFYTDTAYSNMFNYDSEGYFLRQAYRTEAKYQIARSYAVLACHFELVSNANTYKDLTTRMQKSIETIDAHPADPKPDDIAYQSIDVDNTKWSHYSAPVYSSTFKKSITGWYVPGNGVGLDKIYTSKSSGNLTTNYNSPYKYDEKTANLYKSKLQGKSIYDDLVFAFPYLNRGGSRIMEAERPMNTAFGLGFGGEFTESKFRLEARGVFSFHDLLWYENILYWNGSFKSEKTYDTGDNNNRAIKKFMRFTYK